MKLSHSTAVISESGCGPAMVRRLELKKQDFVVENYSSIRKTMGVGRCIQSEDIVCGGHRWAVLFAPLGSTEGHDEGFASVYFVPTTNATHNVHLMLGIDLLDQSGNGRHICLPGFSDRDVDLVFPTDEVAVSCDCFVRRSSLDSPNSRFLKNDCLKLSVCVGVFTYQEADDSSPSSSFPYIPSSDSGPSEEMQLGDEFVFIEVADRTFCVAKCALAHRCPKLLSYDAHGHLQDIVIPDAIEPCIFQVVLGYIYTARIFQADKKTIFNSDPLDPESFGAKLLAASSMLELKPFQRMCELLLSNKICRESVAPLLHLARRCNASHLKSECLKFQAQHRLDMIKCDRFQLLKENCPLLMAEAVGGSHSFQDNNPSTQKKKQEGVTTLTEEALKMYQTIQFKVGRHWPRFSANKIKTL